ncbi:ABC transporter permease [candidate division KSB1 bacterium]|nr:ABC transporter permease [candidate division KSB1 bacterium]
MKLQQTIALSLNAIQANKLRSMLTTLGIIIGVTTIIGMISVVVGLQNYFAKELSVLGANTFQVQKDPPIQFGHLDEKYQRRKVLTLAHAQEVRDHVSAAKYVGVEVYRWGSTLKYKNQKTNPDVLIGGVTPEYQGANEYYVQDGRFLNHFDVDNSRSVVVLGMDYVKKFFPIENPLGKEIRIDANKFKIIGILEEKGEAFGQSKDNIVLIPISTFEKIYGSKRSVRITVQAKSAESLEIAKEQVIGVLRRARKVPPGEDNDFEIFTSESLIRTFNDITFTIKLFAILIAMVSLLVGGIGVMNIMLVAVTERTREIGIRKAIGARRKSILMQFIVEAIFITEIGGLIGIILAIFLALGVKFGLGIPATIQLWTIILGIGICTVVGLLSGVYPAAKASKLDPIVALRYE